MVCSLLESDLVLGQMPHFKMNCKDYSSLLSNNLLS